jgi:hydroxyethylthiazole kinase
MRSSARVVAPPQGEATANTGVVSRSIAEIFGRVRLKKPRIHCFTNSVAQEFTANILLAAGAVPSMTIAPDEIAAFVSRSGALLVNLGTFDAERRAALPIALEAAAKAGVPVVLDPVLVDASPPRLALAREIMRRNPSVTRLNAAEFAALAGAAPDAQSVCAFARGTRAVIALTGEADLVSDGVRNLAIRNGHPWMARVTAMGCAAGALVAAGLACGGDAFTAAASGLAALGIAGEIAGETARGPGSFAVAILDALANLGAETFIARARLEPAPCEAEARPGPSPPAP